MKPADGHQVRSPHPYSSELYARALSFAGASLSVPEWGTFVLIREIDATDSEDATGPYPRTHFAADSDLAAGLDRLREHGLVSVVAVADPFSGLESKHFESTFSMCRAFKTHLSIERSLGYSPTKHHRDRIRRGHRRCVVEVVSLSDNLDAWTELYGNLVTRHEISGVANFEASYFQELSEMPNLVALGAYVGGEIAGMTLWFEHNGVATSHLTAANALGYSNGANYAMNDAAIQHFSGAALVDLGGGAGLADDPSDGLYQFKQGFSNSSKVALLCGAILDAERYEALSVGKTGDFFPAYRG